jgi:oligopeptide/dipeptide ABC transporter, ATP-binding protein, C-terminal domain
MYAGMIMEIGPTDDVIREARHPYVSLLKSASPAPESGLSRPRIAAVGEIPSLIDPPSGCRFHPRCPRAKRECSEAVPALRDIGGGRKVRCVLG